VLAIEYTLSWIENLLCRFPTKNTANCNVVKVHVTGTINHGREATAGCYVLNPTGVSKTQTRKKKRPDGTVVEVTEEVDSQRTKKDSNLQGTSLMESVVNQLKDTPEEVCV
jgi:hypothetical protein